MPDVKEPVRDQGPAFAVELEALLAESEEPELAEQVANLEIVDWCRCSDDFEARPPRRS